jgi:hypothetical protein
MDREPVDPGFARIDRAVLRADPGRVAPSLSPVPPGAGRPARGAGPRSYSAAATETAPIG